MAALATSAKVQIPKAKLGCNVRGLTRKAAVAPKAVSRNTVAAAVSGEVPDMGKRNVMNLLLVGAIGLPATSLVGGFAYFFVPPGCVSRASIPPRDPHRVRHLFPARQARWRDDAGADI